MVEVIKCGAMRSQIVHPGTAQVFTPGISALHPVFLPLPTPSGTGLIRRSERAS